VTPPFFTRLSKSTARTVGRPVTFALAVLVVLAWAISGPFFDFSDTWQLVINTGTTIITFLMVFLISATQNRDAEAVQLKLDEIIRTQQGAHNMFMGLEELEEDELLKIREEYLRLAERAREAARQGMTDTGVPRTDPAPPKG
jgi:low affinity Fe/Cu permease